MTIYFISIGAVIVQRLIELFVAKSHSKIMLERGAVEYDKSGYRFIVLMHSCFFASMTVEYLLTGREINSYWYLFAVVFLLAQGLRYWAIGSLGVYWNTRIIVLPGSPLIKTGPYKYISHPNYVAVAVELACLPLIFSCYITFCVFLILNFFVLKRRIRIETNALLNENCGKT